MNADACVCVCVHMCACMCMCLPDSGRGRTPILAVPAQFPAAQMCVRKKARARARLKERFGHLLSNLHRKRKNAGIRTVPMPAFFHLSTHAAVAYYRNKQHTCSNKHIAAACMKTSAQAFSPDEMGCYGPQGLQCLYRAPVTLTRK